MSNDDQHRLIKAGAKRQKDMSHRVPPKPPKLCEIIDREFAKPIAIKEGTERRQGTTFEGIMLILNQKVGEGRRRALKIRQKYEAYAKARPAVIVEPNLDPETAKKIYDEFTKTGCWPGDKPEAEPSWLDEYKALTLGERHALYEATNKKGK